MNKNLTKLITAQHICIANIAGAGMSAVAGFCKIALKKNVYGFDNVTHTPFTPGLEKAGIKVTTSFEDTMIPTTDSVLIVSSATPSNHPAILRARQHNVPILHRSQALAAILSHSKPICVGGCHGKSTTSILIHEALENSNHPSSIITGAVINRLNSNFFINPNSDFTITECDESDGSLSVYNGYITVITNVDDDHMEQHANLDKLYQEFAAFAENTHPEGTIIVNGDDPRLVEQTKKIHKNVITYGFSEHCMYRATILKKSPHHTDFCVTYNNEMLLEKVSLAMPIPFNVINSLPSIIIAHTLKENLSHTTETFANFQGLDRRMSFLLESPRTPTIINEYAHHPTAVQHVIQGLNDLHPNKKLIFVFQPHRLERLAFHFQKFAHALKQAQQCIILPIYSPSHAPMSNTKMAHELSVAIQEKGGNAKFSPNFEALEDFLVSLNLQSDSILLFCNAGDLSDFSKRFTQTHYAKFLEKQNA